MAFIVELMKCNCKGCNGEIWSLIRSQEEFDTLSCECCINFNKYMNTEYDSEGNYILNLSNPK